MTLHDARSSSRPHKGRSASGGVRPFPGDPAGALSALSRPSAVGAAGSGFQASRTGVPPPSATTRPLRGEGGAQFGFPCGIPARGESPRKGGSRIVSGALSPRARRMARGPGRPLLQRQFPGRPRARRGALSAGSLTVSWRKSVSGANHAVRRPARPVGETVGIGPSALSPVRARYGRNAPHRCRWRNATVAPGAGVPERSFERASSTEVQHLSQAIERRKSTHSGCYVVASTAQTAFDLTDLATRAVFIRHAVCSSRRSISPFRVAKSIGLVSTPSAPSSIARRLVSASP